MRDLKNEHAANIALAQAGSGYHPNFIKPTPERKIKKISLFLRILSKIGV